MNTCFVKSATVAALMIANAFTLKAQEEVAEVNSAAMEKKESVGNQLGGHFGFVHGLVTFSNGKTTSIADSGNYSIGFPTGVTIKTSSNFAFDIEFVPFVSENHKVTLLFHPGGLYSLGGNFTFGTRLAFEINNASYGFTPLLNKAFPLKGGGAFFLELVVPVRFFDGGSATTIGLHVGVGF